MKVNAFFFSNLCRQKKRHIWIHSFFGKHIKIRASLRHTNIKYRNARYRTIYSQSTSSLTGAVRGDSFFLSMTALVATQTIWSPFTSRVAEKVYRLIVSVVVSGCGVRSEVRGQI